MRARVLVEVVRCKSGTSRREAELQASSRALGRELEAGLGQRFDSTVEVVRRHPSTREPTFAVKVYRIEER